MTRTCQRRRARRGFTLVELMVATALVVLILTILAVAFGAATESLSRLRSMGNMATGLRGAQDKLRADLESEHFESGDSPGTLRLSDLRYDLLTLGGNEAFPPLAGYFRIEQIGASVYEGEDVDRGSSTRAVNHVLEFTSKRQGTSPDDLYVIPATTAELRAQNVSDTVIGSQFVSKWARVRWFLGNGQNIGGVQTFTLYRSVRVVSPVSGLPLAPAILTAAELPLVSHTSANRTHDLRDLINPFVRQDADGVGIPTRFTQPYQPGTAYQGDDIVLSNVTSFEVKPTWTGGSRGPRQFMPAAVAINNPVPEGAAGTTQNMDFPYDDMPLVAENPVLNGQRVFDTWAPISATPLPPLPPTPLNSWDRPGSDQSIPLRIRITALQVKIRVYDPKTQLSRQISFIVQP